MARTNHHALNAKELSAISFLNHKGQPLDELLKLCLQSNQEILWTEFVHRSQPVITGVVMKTMCRWISPNPGLVDDLVQETYLKLCLNDFRALRQFVCRHENALFGFLKVVASNVVQDHFRSTYSQKRGSGMSDVPSDCISSVPTAAHPFIAVERDALMQAIDRCLANYLENSNSVRYRSIFWLYYRNGLTAKEISRLPSVKLGLKGIESTILKLTRIAKLKFCH
jgi:RNA polymerase sigma-70 factor, ECF subfamily